MNVVKEHVKFLVNKEYEAVNETHKPIASLHEGYAVLLEEVEETREAISRVEHHIAIMWKHLRENSEESSVRRVDYIKAQAIETACEAIQVAAVCRRILDGYEEENNVKT